MDEVKVLEQEGNLKALVNLAERDEALRSEALARAEERAGCGDRSEARIKREQAAERRRDAEKARQAIARLEAAEEA